MLSSSNLETESENFIDISVQGRWVKVPAVRVNGNVIVFRGKWVKIASVHDEDWLETEVEDPELCKRVLQDHTSPRAAIFTFSQKIPNTIPRYPYALEWDSVAAVKLTTFKDWWVALPQESRKNVRRAEKRGVVVKVRKLDDDLVHEIIQVNNDSPTRQGIRYSHYGKSFDEVKRDHSAFLDRSDFICAYSGDELIGFAKLVYRGDVGALLQFVPKASEHDKRPANALLAKTVELCTARGITHLTYGKFNYGNKRDSSLREFKTRNGFEEVLVPKYYVPLTIWGRLCVRMKVHRGAHGLLPGFVIQGVVAARAKWYNFKKTMGRCSSTSERPNCNRQMERSTPPAGSNA